MQNKILLLAMKSSIFITTLFMSFIVYGQSGSKDKKIVADTKDAKADFIKTDGLMSNLFTNTYGYVIFPNVGKGGIGIGGAAGNGAVYQKGKLIGMAKMTQVTIGFQ